MRVVLATILVVFLLAAEASGQTTRPAAPGWAKAAEQFASALALQDGAAAQKLLAPEATVQAFGGIAADVPALLGRVKDAALLGTHAYAEPATSIATDLAEDAKRSGVPGEVRRRLMLKDEAAAHNANGTAGKWASQVLQTANGEALAIVAFYAQPTEAQPAACQITFVLLKGHIPAQGEPQVRAVLFGDPR